MQYTFRKLAASILKFGGQNAGKMRLSAEKYRAILRLLRQSGGTYAANNALIPAVKVCLCGGLLWKYLPAFGGSFLYGIFADYTEDCQYFFCGEIFAAPPRRTITRAPFSHILTTWLPICTRRTLALHLYVAKNAARRTENK